MSSHIPLSLRRKLVIALDADVLAAPARPDTSEEASEAVDNRYASFKTVAWIKANIIRPMQDHVFLVTSVDPNAAPIDTATISAMWTSMFGGSDEHVDRVKVAEASLRRLAEALNRVGVSTSIDVLMGAPGEKVPEYVHQHKGEILIVQAPSRSVLAQTFSYSWADLCAHTTECPTVLVKQTDLPDNIAVALDPPLPTATVEQMAPPGEEENA
ncbi:hypothetical protein GQ54DRAFT_313528 [Martensiomyces pterosporus]|nr:hypothetical protein GQ54DRAFT_313528 [Martensiomyces pterosporus]